MHWPNESNRTVYPPIGPNAPPITKPTPLDQGILDRYEAYVKEHTTLIKDKQALEDKSARLGKELDAEGVKGVWSRKDQGLIRRLTAECELVTRERLALEQKIDSLVSGNVTLINVISAHESCVKGYDEYLAWKDEMASLIRDAVKC